MNNLPPPIPKNKPGGQRIWIVLAIVFGGGLCVSLLLVGLWRLNLRKDVDRRTAAIRAEGMPVNWDDLKSWPEKVEESNNAAAIFLRAIDELPVENLESFELPRRAELIPEDLKSNIQAILPAASKALEIVRQIDQPARSRYPINFDDGPTAKLPHLRGLKVLADAFRCEAIERADEKDSDGAVVAIEASLNVSRSLDNEPILSSQWQSAAILKEAGESLENVLCRISLPDPSLARLMHEFETVEATDRFVTALIGERALAGEFIRLAQDDVSRMIEIANRGSDEKDKTKLPFGNPGVGWRALGFFERDRNFFLDAMQTYIAIARIGPPASLARTNETDQIEERARKRLFLLSSLFLPAFSRTQPSDAAARACLRTAHAALAMERWRLAHQGSLPDSLAELIPSVLPRMPLDPFDGEPLRFKKTAKGYVIYSVGRDGKDDGGAEQPPRSVRVPKEQRNHFDITFTVER